MATPHDFTALPGVTAQPSPGSAHNSSASRTRHSGSRDSDSRSSGRKPASYDETALQISSSPPLTSFLNDRRSASSAQEEAYLNHAFRLRVVRLVLSVLTIGTALAAVGCAGHVLRSYNKTRLGNDWHLPLWPIAIDLKPTLGILVPAAIAAVASLCYAVVAVIPSPRSRTSLLTTCYLASTLTTLSVSIFALTFNPVLVHHTDPSVPRQTLQTFTCRFYRGAGSFNSAADDLGIPLMGGKMSYPAGFKRMCVESEASVGLMAAVGALSLLGVAVGGLGMVLDRRIERGRKERWEEKWDAKA